MGRTKQFLAPALVGGVALVYAWSRRRDLGRLVQNMRRYSAPTAALYDAVSAPLLGSFYGRIAADLAARAPGGHVLDVGAGPGRLATGLAALAPRIEVAGIDIAPDMVARATALAAERGVAGRVTFRLGDVMALPFPDESFDIVVSTLSLHHWPNPALGLAEIYRVLRPGGIARIYDVVDWVRRVEQSGPGIAELARVGPFGNGGTITYRIEISLGPVPLIYRADLWRAEAVVPHDGGQSGR
jgi:SAM-dependent methyltransferase